MRLGASDSFRSMWNNKRKSKTSGKTEHQKLVATLDRWFSKYIRLRDSFVSNGELFFRCISYGKIKSYDEADCGHYINRGHMSTRFDEDNCHAQCKFCNRFDEGNIYNYRERLVNKIGLSRVLLLEAKKNQTCKLGDFELKALISHYKAEVKKLEEEKRK